MTQTPTTILCTGDIHLGRHPTRIPEHLDGPRLSPKHVWDRTIQHALQTDIDAVLVTGDLLDRENRYYEAYGPIETAARRLDDAGIPLVLVAGNHDFDELPRLAHTLDLDTLHLLGEDGTWDRWTLTRDDEPLLHFDGWSFPTEHVLDDPLETYDPDPDPSTPTIGLLHADVDTPDSRYAPTPTQALADAPVDAWILGHIHKPHRPHAQDPLVLYPGSPQPLNPGEPGPHGPWTLHIDPDGSLHAEQHALATVRYDPVQANIDGAADPKDTPPLVSSSLREHLERVDTSSLEVFLPRVTLTGRTPIHARLHDEKDALEDQLSFKHERLPIHVETLRVDTRPDANLDDLATGETPAAWLAQLLIDLQDDQLDASRQDVIDDAHRAMRTAHGSGAYTELRRQGWTKRPTREDARNQLRKQARLLLDQLLEQKEGPA